MSDNQWDGTQNVSDPVDIKDGRTHLSNYTLNELKSLLIGNQDTKARTVSIAQQPDDDYVEDKADGQAVVLNGGLDANEIVTSEWVDTDGWRTIEIFATSSVQSAEDGFEIQFSRDIQATTPKVDASKNLTYANEQVDRGFGSFDFGTKLDGFRVKWTNGDSPAPDFSLITTLREPATPDSADYVGVNPIGDTFVTVGTSPTKTGVGIAEPTSLFTDLQTIERRTVIDATSTFGTSVLRDEITSTGSGSVEGNPAQTGEIKIGTGTTPNSSIKIQTTEYGRYTPGFSAQAGVGVRIPTLPTEGEVRWGYFTDENGFYWGYDGGQEELFVARRKDSTETERIYRSNFNRQNISDRINRTWNPDEGDIFQIDFSWYGYGIIIFTIVTQTPEDNLQGTPRQVSVPVHAIAVNNETSTADPNEPINVEVENGDSGEDIDVYIGGRQFSVFGEPPAEQRVTSETNSVSVSNGSWTYVQSWRRDPAEDANSKLNIRDLSFSTDGDVRWALLVGPNISGTSYGLPELTNGDETLLEVSNTGSFDGIGAGTKIFEEHVDATGGGPQPVAGGGSQSVDVRLGQENELVLVANGTGNEPTITATLRMLEDW